MLNTSTHRQILFTIIRDIYQSPAGGSLGFKGGTMLYFFHNLDRFSIDLDFDLLDDSKKETVGTEVKKILERHGKVKDEADKSNTLYFLLSYGIGEHSVKIEISKRMPPQNTYEIKNFYGTDVSVAKLEDAFANKLVAATERKRTANRDFYDIWFLFKKGVMPNKGIVETRTGKSFTEYVKNLRDFVEKNIVENSILEGVGELVDNSQKDWLKKRFKGELLAQLDFFKRSSRVGGSALSCLLSIHALIECHYTRLIRLGRQKREAAQER
jgi:predicted nucleotidyltransferase component of viral defense system